MGLSKSIVPATGGGGTATQAPQNWLCVFIVKLY